MSIRYEEPVSPSIKRFAENVRRLRVSRGWSQGQLGERVGDTWPQERISELESGKFDKVLSIVDEFARALKVKPWELIMPGGGGDGANAGRA